jgi:hypothetical protein
MARLAQFSIKAKVIVAFGFLFCTIVGLGTFSVLRVQARQAERLTAEVNSFVTGLRAA